MSALKATPVNHTWSSVSPSRQGVPEAIVWRCWISAKLICLKKHLRLKVEESRADGDPAWNPSMVMADGSPEDFEPLAVRVSRLTWPQIGFLILLLRMPSRSFSEINVFKRENWNATNSATDAAKIMQKLNSEAQPAPWIIGLTVSIQRRMPGTRILWNGIPLVGRENHLLPAGVWRRLVSYSNLLELITQRSQLERIPRFLQ